MATSKTKSGLVGLLKDESKKRLYEFLDAGLHRVWPILMSTIECSPHHAENQDPYLSSSRLSRDDYYGIFNVRTMHVDGNDGIETILGRRNNEIKVGLWNIQCGIRWENIIEVLQDGFGLDFINLVEVSRFHPWADHKDLLDIIVGKTGFTQVIYSPSFILPEEARPFPEIGNAILSRHRLSEGRVLRLGQAYERWHKDTPYPKVGERIALYATVQIKDKKIGLYGPHLELRCPTSVRVKQLKQIFDDADLTGHDKIIVAGDINEWSLWNPKPEADEITQLAISRGYRDPFGDSSMRTLNNLLAIIDYLSTNVYLPPGAKFTADRILSKGFEVMEFDVMDHINITDHFPVKAILGYR